MIARLQRLQPCSTELERRAVDHREQYAPSPTGLVIGCGMVGHVRPGETLRIFLKLHSNLEERQVWATLTEHDSTA